MNLKLIKIISEALRKLTNSIIITKKASMFILKIIIYSVNLVMIRLFYLFYSRHSFSKTTKHVHQYQIPEAGVLGTLLCSKSATLYRHQPKKRKDRKKKEREFQKGVPYFLSMKKGSSKNWVDLSYAFERKSEIFSAASQVKKNVLKAWNS